MIIQTPRLVLRPWQRSDLDIMAAWPPFPDPLDAIWNWPRTLREQGTTDLFFLMRANDQTRREWTIITDTEMLVGYLQLRSINPDGKRARLGIGFGYPYLGLGYGSEALQSFLPLCFSSLGLYQIELDVATYNVRARRLYQRLGFRETGTTWLPLGTTIPNDVLAQPPYTAIRPLLRLEGNKHYVLSIEMELCHDEVQPGVSP
jgi:RimJ/RimL family protein N-acetyltransferase